MKTETMLKIQSWVDGRLSAGENAEIEKLVASDADARALAQELRMTKAMFTGCEPEVKMPESREFFWSKVEREIQRQEAAGVAGSAHAGFFAPGWLRRLILPVSGVAAVAVIALVAVKSGREDLGYEDVEWSAEDVKAVTYRDQSTGMRVIWVDKNEPMSDEPTSIDNIETK